MITTQNGIIDFSVLNYICDTGVIAIDSDGIIIYYNDFAAQNDGFSNEEVLGKHYLEVYPGEKSGGTLQQTLKYKKPLLNTVNTYHARSGKQTFSFERV